MNIEQFLNQENLLVKPETADAIRIVYSGITFNIYGVLHGITGGTNKEYISFINKTIQAAPGLKLAEKSMKKIYKGLDDEVDDWIQVPNKDVFKLTLKLFTSPVAFLTVMKILWIEKTTSQDKFDVENRKKESLGGSPYFHLLDPILRREYIGFPPPNEYFIKNYERRHNIQHSTIKMMDKDWKWLEYIEPFVNIPYRSIHMVECAVIKATEKNIKEVSLFVGETHNSDIFWYINKTKNDDFIDKEIEKIKNDAKNINRFKKKISYLFFCALAATIPMLFFLFLTISYSFIKLP